MYYDDDENIILDGNFGLGSDIHSSSNSFLCSSTSDSEIALSTRDISMYHLSFFAFLALHPRA
eukprot:c29643_g1_i1 orf=40-228(-)